MRMKTPLLLSLLVGLGLAFVIGTAFLYAAPQTTPVTKRIAPQSMPAPALQQALTAPQKPSSTAPLPLSIHTVGPPTATPTVIAVATSTQVTVSIQIIDPGLIPNSVNLLRLGPAGAQPAILGTMQNAGNGLYAFTATFDEPVVGFIQLQVSAAFAGSLSRILSNVITLGVGITPPPGWIVNQDGYNDYSLYSPASNAAISAGGVDTPPDMTVTSVGNPASLPLTSFFNGDAAGWFATYESVTTTTVAGHQVLIASDLASSIPRTPSLAAYVAQQSTSVLIITGGSLSEQQFNLMLQSLQLP